jgi:predicted dehydrogenase/nucleoside-diphosphate-sugar epimerase
MFQSPKVSEPLRVAIVGCGAVTRASLLPVLAGHDGIDVVALVDRDLARARALADAYHITRVEADSSAITRAEADGLVIATPPAHHAPAAIDAASRGFHLFVEKPMATRAADAEAMVVAASRAGVILSVGLYRRLLPVARLMRGFLEAGLLGRPVSADLEEGGGYTWPLTTLAGLTRNTGGGGVLIDVGTHVLDQLLYVLPGAARVERYIDNARGGIETDCELHLRIGTPWGEVPARVELSRTRDLRGTLRVACERGTLELVRGDFCNLRILTEPGEVLDTVADLARPVRLAAAWSDQGELVGYKAFRAEFDDWLDAIRRAGEPTLSGRSTVPVVSLIEACYASPSEWREPWTDESSVIDAVRSRGPAVIGTARPKVLVTGAGGFLGCRTAELLHLSGRWDVRALVRQPSSAARLARWPIEIVLGDVVSAPEMERAVDGCEAVVHCAVGTTWPPEAAFKVTVDGTRTTAEAALASGTRRFVHISSMAVHGDRVPPRLDEQVPLEPGTGFGYSRAKYLAEQTISRLAAQGLPAISLRPARIYGPFSKTFTVRPLAALRGGGLVLSGDADTPSNMVYVDNVVEAIARALDAPATEHGEAFLISEPDQISWRAFFGFFADAAGANFAVADYDPPAAAPRGGIGRWVQGGRQIVLSPELRALAKKVMWTDPFGTWPRKLWDRSPALQRRVLGALGVDAAVVYREALPRTPEPTVFRIDPTLVVFDKAMSRLAYVGLVPRSRAMELTLEWARRARLVR